MGVICFASLKGGVGKTSAAVNVSHALAKRDCQTLLIDLDPTAHATGFFIRDRVDSPLAVLFSKYREDPALHGDGLLEAVHAGRMPLMKQVRSCLSLLPGGADLRGLLTTQCSETFCALLNRLLSELNPLFDHIVIDTSPDLLALSGAAVSASALTVVPIDGSAMSIAGLEALVQDGSRSHEPCWAVLRMMVNRAARRVSRLSAERLEQNVKPRAHEFWEDQDSEESPIFLLNSIIYRTEAQNRLSYEARTALDEPSSALSDQYLCLARELEEVLALCEERENQEPVMGELWEALAAMSHQTVMEDEVSS